MKHHQYNPNFEFVKSPEAFNKYSARELLPFCLGATLYMPANKQMAEKIIRKQLPGLTSMVMCFEDAISLQDLPEAEKSVLDLLTTLTNAINGGKVKFDDIPLIFLRVRSVEQFRDFSERLTSEQIKGLTGFVFPKFRNSDGYKYLKQLNHLKYKFNDVLYGMPILESPEIAFSESRLVELNSIRSLLHPFRELILNIRVGATDLSSLFGMRRGVNYSIYDILTINDCLTAILNCFNRQGEDYVISAPVWEYFLADKKTPIDHKAIDNFQETLLTRSLIFNREIDGLLREVILDKANGFVGKTIIHPSHLKYVNALQAVTKEEYDDATQIIEHAGAVVKSHSQNKMNEMNPHMSWAKKTRYRAMAYGVIASESEYIKLFSV